MKDIVNHRERWRKKFGDEEVSPVSPRLVYGELERIVEPERLGLERIRDRFYGRAVDADIVRLLAFQPYKGGAYGIRWGVSLSFVPHDFERGIRFHRTLRSARFDLFEDALDVAGGDSLDDRVVHGLYGERVFRESAERAWRLLAEHVSRWWSETWTVDGVLETARAQAEAPPATAGHWPPPRLVEAFSLARLGHRDHAEDVLSRWTADRREELGPRAVANLDAALDKVTPERPFRP